MRICGQAHGFRSPYAGIPCFLPNGITLRHLRTIYTLRETHRYCFLMGFQGWNPNVEGQYRKCSHSKGSIEEEVSTIFLGKILPFREIRFCTSLERNIFHRFGDLRAKSESSASLHCDRRSMALPYPYGRRLEAEISTMSLVKLSLIVFMMASILQPEPCVVDTCHRGMVSFESFCGKAVRDL
jgi:hypothetical protein